MSQQTAVSDDALAGRSAARLSKTFNLAEWTVADGPSGLSVALQCLLWPMWQDPGQQTFTSGLVKHLWKRIVQAPNAAIHLKGDLFWMPLASRWCTVQAHPTSLHRLMLHTFSSSYNPGEWGVHLHNFGVTPEVTLRSSIMLLPLCVHTPSQPLQEKVDAWASSIGRPVLRGRVATVYQSLEEVCIRTQGIRDTSWPFIRPCPQLTDVLWLPGLGSDGNFLHYQYEIRTLVFQHSSEALGLSYTAEHWASQKQSHSAKPSVSAATDTTKLSLLVLRSTGQEKFSEECVRPSL